MPVDPVSDSPLPRSPNRHSDSRNGEGSKKTARTEDYEAELRSREARDEDLRRAEDRRHVRMREQENQEAASRERSRARMESETKGRYLDEFV